MVSIVHLGQDLGSCNVSVSSRTQNVSSWFCLGQTSVSVSELCGSGLISFLLHTAKIKSARSRLHTLRSTETACSQDILAAADCEWCWPV